MRTIDADTLKKDLGMGDRCEDCPRDARECQYEPIYTRMDVCGLIDDAPTVGGWISVKDRMPENNKDVLICGEWTGASGTKYRELFLSSMKDFIYQGYTPIAWMPLPEPPKEERADDA